MGLCDITTTARRDCDQLALAEAGIQKDMRPIE